MYNDDDGGDDKENESISRTEHHYFSRARTVTEKTNAKHRFSAIINPQLCAKAGVGKLWTACCLFAGIFFFLTNC